MRALTTTARWTPDCQGKWDYDGRYLVVSCRYWPQGGGFHTFSQATGFRPSIETNPDVKPSAVAAIHLEHGEADENGHNADYLVIVEKHFSADTEAEVKALVEIWVQEQLSTINGLVFAHYGTPKKP
jgi:hypothetical protein